MFTKKCLGNQIPNFLVGYLEAKREIHICIVSVVHVIAKVAYQPLHNTSKKHIELSSCAKVDSAFNMPSMINQKAVIKNIK